ncbi:hypothetical protein [Cytobacillus sp. IB215665]|uniref:hypothetical protein n=1 Tax=Cytobacillus sp. IB215665 TaxID=3097357 RepID=UPI002A180606|nr:hypothetical protein [Cytobacillus sp. IB215665]MDX8367266.1 hypothetical protein [Cytobacillus sp. IB215665]
MEVSLKMFVEYPINDLHIYQYEQVMEDVLFFLTEFEAAKIEWYRTSSGYIESFYLPTRSHYFALRKVRKQKNHSIFGQFEKFVDGGLKNIHSWAIVS